MSMANDKKTPRKLKSRVVILEFKPEAPGKI